MQILNLFPTHVFIEENNEIDNKKLSRIILKKEKTELSREMSNQGGWQSNNDLHEDKRFSEVLESISKYLKLIFKNYNYVEGLKFYITGVWANVNRYKDYNMAHTHPRSDWSFVYYVKVHKDCGNLIFVDPRIRREPNLDKFIKDYDNPFTHDIYSMNCAEGRFAIFPSYLEHYVEFNTTDKPRISISGNIRVGE